MKLLIARIIVAGIGLLLVFGRYGSLEPCDMLRAEVQRQLLASIADERAADELTALGTVHGMTTLRDMLEATTAGRSPGECLATLVRLHGDARLSAMLEAGAAPEANAAGAESPRAVSVPGPDDAPQSAGP